MAGNVLLQNDLKYGGCKGDAGIKLFLEYERYTFTKHIAQYAAEDASNDGSNNGNDWPVAHIQRNLSADD